MSWICGKCIFVVWHIFSVAKVHYAYQEMHILLFKMQECENLFIECLWNEEFYAAITLFYDNMSILKVNTKSHQSIFSLYFIGSSRSQFLSCFFRKEIELHHHYLTRYIPSHMYFCGQSWKTLTAPPFLNENMCIQKVYLWREFKITILNYKVYYCKY
jgi:hypothetical protein